MHKLLERQIRRTVGDPEALAPNIQPLLGLVDSTYRDADADRILLERSMDIAGAELLEQNRELVEAQRIARLGSWSVDLVAGITMWSPTMYHIYGVDPATFKPTREAAMGLIHPQDRARVRSQEEGGMETKQGGTIAFRVTRPDGAVVHIHGEYRVVLDDEGRPVRLLGTSRDVTAEWEAALALRESVSLLNATLNSTADGILVVDCNGKIVSTNRKFIELWRIPQEIVDSHSDERALGFVLDQLSDPQGFIDKVRYLYTHPDEESFDVLAFKDGRTFERFSQPQRIQEQTVGRVWSFRDVTESRRAQSEREASRGRALELERFKEMDRFKTHLLNIASHELNTPVAALKLQLYILKSRLGNRLGEEGAESIALLERNVQRLATLIASTLDVSRIQSGALTLNRTTLGLAHLAGEVVGELGPVAAQAGVSLRMAAPSFANVEADPTRLAQVVYNLVANAIKYAPPGGEVIIVTERRGSLAICEVRGPGIGISPDQMACLFQPFTQVQVGSDQRPGTGLGLFISKAIVEQHGGRIWCESGGPGQGAIFSFELPIVGAIAAPARAKPARTDALIAPTP